MSELIKSFENPQRVGLDEKGRWMPFEVSDEETDIGYGHMLTPQELKSGYVSIGGQRHDYRKGLTDAQVEKLLAQDTKRAKSFVEKTYPDLNRQQREAVTSLVYNVGVGGFERSAAAKALAKGDLKTFIHEAFDEHAGFVRAGGKILGGLVKRRAAEAELFGTEPAPQPQAQDIASMFQPAVRTPAGQAGQTAAAPSTPVGGWPALSSLFRRVAAQA